MITALLLSIVSQSSLAASGAPAEPAIDCTEPMTQSDMNYCAMRSYKDADDELNRVWRSIRNGFATKRQAQALVDVQRKWLTYRDAECDYEAGRYEGGSMQPLVRYSCLEDLTRARTKLLLDDLEI